MKIEVVKQSQLLVSDNAVCIIPFELDVRPEAQPDAQAQVASGVPVVPGEVEAVVKTAISSGAFVPGKTKSLTLSIVVNNKIVNIILFKCPKWTKPEDGRKIFLAFAGAFRTCRNLNAKNIEVFIDNAPSLKAPEIFGKLAETPLLVDYRFEKYKHSKEADTSQRFESVKFITDDANIAGLASAAREGAIIGEEGCIARELINEPACVLTPEELAKRAVAMVADVNKETGNNNLSAQVFEPDEIKAMGMECFLSVGRGSRNAGTPRLIVLRYRGADDNAPVTALVGKGICYDSGGYNIKSNPSMCRMFGDMSGGAAVFGAICAAARTGVKINAVAICAACENKISEDSYLPGDIIKSMSGKYIEMLNSDAEGRMTLIDAITYSIHKENAAKIIDIATLTGAARGAVGVRTAAVLTNNDDLLDAAKRASYIACEKIWQLDCDEELRPQIESKVADFKNSALGAPLGGGTITGGLFLREFAEDVPWLHVDMASVAFLQGEGQPWCDAGATGWGTALMFRLLGQLSE